MYKKYIVYIIIIFLTFVIVGNIIIYKAPNNAINSMDFSKIANSIYKREVSIESRLNDKILQHISDLRNGECEKFYYLLTDQCKEKFNNNLSSFKQSISSKYLAEKSNFELQYLGYDDDDKSYLFNISIEYQPYLTDEERKMEVYEPKDIYLKIYLDKDENYLIDFDI